MLKSIQQRDLDRNRWIKIAMTVILVLICVSMVITLIPGLFGGPALSSNPDSVATVAGQDVTAVAIQQQLNQMSRGQTIPSMMRGLYTKQVFDQMVFQAALEYEAQRLSMQVTPEEIRDRVQEILPTAFSGNRLLMDDYVQQVQRAGMSVPEFETALRQGLLAEKFEHLITDGITVTPAEIDQEFRRRNEKIAIQYALIKPVDIASTIHPTDDQLAAYFKTNMGKYQIPEKRSAQYVLLDVSKLRAQIHVGDDVLRAYYNDHLDDYKVQNGAHIEQILFKTLSKTDAEVAELTKKADDIVKQARHGANFEDLAKKYSEDDQTKAKGGDRGWIGEGQTAPQVEQAAFSLPKGSVSDVIKTTYGLVIIKVVDRQSAHTKPFEEVRDSILPVVLDQQVSTQANNIANDMASAVRQSDRQPISDIARKFNLEVQTAPPVAITDLAVGPLGNSPDVRQALFQLQPGELSSPIRTDAGYVIVTPKEVLPAHQASLAEVHDKVLADYQQEKSVEMARAKADELAKQAQSGGPFDKAAKSLGLEVKTAEPFSRTGSVPDIGSASQLDSAFTMKVDQVSAPKMVGGNWLVYRVTSHESANIDDLAKQKQDIEQQLLQSKQGAAFAAFKTALKDRMKQEGKLTINQEALNRLTQSQ
ncbi:MAG TPA: peptidyl-prolyl cis-trans isomerase [Candidatus Limnocylindrales bacterium]|nr:peptidyl-prolyl cis-trans isomerase [Candidatus Limnocylindrales bacterium]